MFYPRIIPVLLLLDSGLVKSVKFRNHRYLGDPINAAKLFNDLRADELVFLDITASREGRVISLEFIRKLGDECNMPFSVGGGIKSLNDIKQILRAGAEKVIINTAAVRDPEFVNNASREFGSSTIVISIDVGKRILRTETTYINSAREATGYDPVSYACLMQEKGAGELLIQSIEHDGTMIGYDLGLISRISNKITIPVIACSGAGNMSHMVSAYYEANATALAAGSMFVYHGPRKAVLINYPEREQVISLFKIPK
jgi:imidazole glycerol-phosphate synthase subunit HisF